MMYLLMYSYLFNELLNELTGLLNDMNMKYLNDDLTAAAAAILIFITKPTTITNNSLQKIHKLYKRS